jgi:hypothetical protein
LSPPVVVPGAKIQVLDLPGIIEGAKDGKGRGRQVCGAFGAPSLPTVAPNSPIFFSVPPCVQVIGTARTCNVVLIVLDATRLVPVLYAWGGVCAGVLPVPCPRNHSASLPTIDRPLTHKKLIEHELEGFGIRLNKVGWLLRGG